MVLIIMNERSSLVVSIILTSLTLLSFNASASASELPGYLFPFPEQEANVQDFGAVPNDGLDDSTSFQKAIHVAAVQTHRLYLPPGSYTIDKQLSIPSNLTIYGDSKEDTFLIRQNFSLPLNLTKQKARDVFHVEGTPEKYITNVAITNLTIIGSGAGTMGDCVELEQVRNYTIRDTDLTGCGSGPDGAAIYTQQSADGAIIHNVIDKSRNGYLSAKIKGGSTNILIAYNNITNSIDDAIHPQNGSLNRIIGNIVSNSGDDNIDTFLETNTIIENNTILTRDNSTHITGIEIGDESQHILVKGNRIIGPASYGINLGTDIIKYPLRYNRYITLIDNQIKNTFEGCVRAAFSVNVKIMNNTLLGCDSVSKGIGYWIGITGSARNASISNNLVEYHGRAQSSGIMINNARYIDIISNTINVIYPKNNLYGSGINIGMLSNDVLIKDNDLEGCGCIIRNHSSQPNLLIQH